MTVDDRLFEQVVEQWPQRAVGEPVVVAVGDVRAQFDRVQIAPQAVDP
jgi:hypothetical protein